MHTFVLMLAIFFNIQPDGTTPPVKVAALVETSAKACLDDAALADAQFGQDPKVHAVKAACFDVDGHNDSDKAS